MRFIFLFPFLLLVFFAGAQDSNYQAIFLDKKLAENANAVVRLDEMTLDIASHKKLTYTVRQIVTVLNKKGDTFAKTHVFYDKEKKIKNLEAYVYDKHGRELEHIKSRDFQDVSAADGFSLYRDDRILQYRYTPTQYPYTLEISYEAETCDTGVFPPWYFLSGANLSVEKSRYSIKYTSNNLRPVIREFNLTDYPVQKEEANGIISYSANGIPALERESLAPDFRDLVPHLVVRLPEFHYKGYDARVNNWKELGIWIENHLLKGRSELPAGAKAKVRALVFGVEDTLEKAKIIYRYVQENTRYVSVQIGIGGFRPISAIDVDRVKYGDCKGLSNYTKALLEAVGVPAYYTIIEAGDQKVDFEDDFADLRQGNHVILAIPYNNKYYWIDCTSQIHPFGFLGDFTDDRKVLVVTPDGGTIVKTEAYLDEQNYQNTNARYRLSEDGSISGTLSITTKGIQYDNRFFIKEYSDEDLVKHYKRYLGDINNLQVISHSFENDRDKVTFREDLKISASNYGSLSGERIFLTVNAFNRNKSVPKRYRNRNYPFEVQRGYLDDDDFTVKLPKGYSIETLPDKTLVENEFGRYSTEFVHNPVDHTVRYRRSLLIRHGQYPKEQYTYYRDFRKKVASADSAQMVLIRNLSK